MKKILIFTLVVLMLAVNVFAADATYDEDELKQLLTDTFDIYVEFVRNFNDYEVGSAVQLYSTDELFTDVEPYTEFGRHNGEFRKFDDFKQVLYSCVTSDVGDYFIEYQHILNINGYTYSCTFAMQNQNQGVWFEPTDMGSEEFEHFDLDSTFEVVSATDDKIEAKFLLYFFDHENPIREFTVEYTKATDGWRISGGTFVSTMFNHPYKAIYPDQAPQTGVDTFAYAAVAVVALAAVAVVVKKRKKA